MDTFLLRPTGRLFPTWSRMVLVHLTLYSPHMSAGAHWVCLLSGSSSLSRSQSWRTFLTSWQNLTRLTSLFWNVFFLHSVVPFSLILLLSFCNLLHFTCCLIFHDSHLKYPCFLGAHRGFLFSLHMFFEGESHSHPWFQLSLHAGHFLVYISTGSSFECPMGTFSLAYLKLNSSSVFLHPLLLF